MLASQPRDALRNPDGYFKELAARRCLGSSVRIFLKQDRSRQRAAEGRTLRHLELCAKRRGPSHHWSQRRGRFVELLCDGCPVVRVIWSAEDKVGAEAKFKAHNKGVKSTKIRVVDLVQNFRAEES